MPWGAVAGAAIGAIGSSMAADSAEDAASEQAQAQRDAAAMGADAARFRPVGISTRFGNSAFKVGENGLELASYNLDPTVAHSMNSILGQQSLGIQIGAGNITNGMRLQNLGQQYLATSPEQAAQSWMASQQNLLAPTRERQLANVRNGLFQSGREGLAVGATGARPDGSAGLGAANPELEAYYNAIAQQDAGLATQAQEQGRQQTLFGTNLMSQGNTLAAAAYSPLTSWLGAADSIDALGRTTLDMGAQLGGRSATAGASVGNMLMQGGMAAANTLGSVAGYSPWGAALQGVASNPRIQGMFSQYMQPSSNSGWAGMGTGYSGYSDYGMASGASGAWV